jgi:TonB family protein
MFFKKKTNGVIGLNLDPSGGAAALPKPFVPKHKVVVLKEAVTIEVTEHRDDRMTAEIAISLDMLKGKWKADLPTGALRLFAADIAKARQAQAGSAKVALVPGKLALIAYHDKGQFFFAVNHTGRLGVGMIATLPLAAAEWPPLVDSLEMADPGELTEEGIQRLREEAARPVPQPVPPTPPPLPSVPPDKVVLTIGDEGITAAEFNHILESVPAQLRWQRRDEFARQFIRRRVATQEARRRKLDERPTFRERMAQEAEQLLTMELWQELNAAIKVDEEACRAYYEEHQREFDRAKVSRIVIRAPGSPWPVKIGRTALTDQQALAKAHEIRGRLVNGEDFAAVAKQESDEALATAKGGDAGWWDRPPEAAILRDQVRAAAFTLPVGEISEPIKGDHGYELLRVDERRHRTYTEARKDAELRLKTILVNKAEEKLQIDTCVALDSEYFGRPDTAEVTSPRINESVPLSVAKGPASPQRTSTPGSLQALQLIRGGPPVYPRQAKAAGISGHVTLYVVISKDGTLLEAHPASGDPMLAEAAMEAVRDWLWRPTISLGLAQEVITQIDFEFRLSQKQNAD